jgi:hypothetical protein
MAKSHSWKADRFPASQEIPRILWDPKVHYHIHKSPQGGRLSSEMAGPYEDMIMVHYTAWYVTWFFVSKETAVYFKPFRY